MNVDINNISIDDDENDNDIIIDGIYYPRFSLSCWVLRTGTGTEEEE